MGQAGADDDEHIFGPAHSCCLSVYDSKVSFEDVDCENARLGLLTQSDVPHAPERALEVELPFLQTVLSLFQIVALAILSAMGEPVVKVS